MMSKSERRLIQFDIDPKLERIWRTMGLTEEEREDEMRLIEDALMETYRNQIARNGEKMEKLRQELHQQELVFESVKKKFGDKEVRLPSNSNLSIREQIEVAKEVTKDLEVSYQYRILEFKKVLRQLSNAFDKLGASEDEREGYTEVGEEDLSEDRLDMFKQRLASLQQECQRRKDVMDSLKSELHDIADELEEEIPEEIKTSFQDLDNESIRAVSSTIDEYKQLRNERVEQVEYLTEEIDDLYHILAIDPSDRIELPSNPSQKTIETLESEKEFLDEQKTIRLPAVLRELNKTITKLCDYMHLPMKERPSYHGSDLEEGVRYLSDELESLKERHIKEKPILDLIYELEKQKDTPSNTPNDRKSPRSVTLRKQGKSTTTQLERQLFSELVKYRRETGRDFMFDNVRYIDQLNVYDEGCHTEKKMRGRDLLMQKINESMSSSGFRTPRRQPSYNM